MRVPLLSVPVLTVFAGAFLMPMAGAMGQTAMPSGGAVFTPGPPGSLPLPTPLEYPDGPDQPAVAPRYTPPPLPEPMDGPDASLAPGSVSPPAATLAPRPSIGAPIPLAPPPVRPSSPSLSSPRPPSTRPGPLWPVPSRPDTGSPAVAANQAATADALAFLRAAREELSAGRTREAAYALEMAQTRLLSRVVDAGQETKPSDDPVVRRMSETLNALTINNRAGAARGIDQVIRLLPGGEAAAAAPSTPPGLSIPSGFSIPSGPPSLARPGDTPPPASEPSPTDLLRAARLSLTTRRLDDARQSLEMAQTRLLSRIVDKGRETQPSDNAAVKQISDALAALSANDRMLCLRYIESASRTLGVTLD